MKQLRSFLLVVLVCFSFLSSALAATANTQWAKSTFSGSNNSEFYSVAIDGSGNIYCSGKTYGDGTYDFGNEVTVNGACGNANNAVLVKYDVNGNAQWIRSIVACGAGSGGPTSNFETVTIDSSGNIYCSGWIQGTGTYDFGNGVTVNGVYTEGNCVLVKYDVNGNAQWARSVVSGSLSSSFGSVAVDDSGNIYAAGYISGNNSYGFGNDVTVNGPNAEDSCNMVLVKYDSDGNAQWAKSTISGGAWFSSVAVDSSGNIYCSGGINRSGTTDFGNGVKVINGSYTGGGTGLVKYDSDGNALWARSSTVDRQAESDIHSVVTDGDGNIYIAGNIDDVNFDFGNGVTVHGTCPDSSNIVLVKYDSSGNAQWAKTTLIGENQSRFLSVAIDGNNNVYASGWVFDISTFDFGNGVTVNGTYDGRNIVLVKYDSDGNTLWAKSTFSGSNASEFYSVATSDANVYANGYISYNSMFDFGNNVTVNGSAATSNNVVIVKYNQPTPTPTPTPNPDVSAGGAITASKWSTILGIGAVIIAAI